MKKLSLLKSGLDVVDSYKNLNIEGVTLTAPYYRNVKRARAELRSLVGKGSAEELIEETRVYSKLYGVTLSKLTPEQIREFMRSKGLGIDCSGYVAYIYEAMLDELGRGSLYRNVRFPTSTGWRKFLNWLRPIENLSANTLTGPLNCERVPLHEVLPGDSIRLKGVDGGHHIALVMEVEYDDNPHPIKIAYTHSIDKFHPDDGVRVGVVNIKDPHGELKDQEWTERDQNGVCWTLKELQIEYEDNGLRRPKFLNDVNWPES